MQRPRPRKPRVAWWVSLIGHVIAALIGLGLGYWMLHWLRPDIRIALVELITMTQPSTPAIGIDLGTTFSVLARIDERGQPVTVVNAEGDRLTPSVVLFEGDDVVVGKEALKAIVTEAQHVAECSKRDVGHRVYHKVLEGKQYPPEVIEALILNKLRVDAEKQIGPIDKAVITVPAYFDEVRRKATQDSGYMAGFEVLDIINEPTAAAVAFGFQQGYLDAEGGTRRAAEHPGLRPRRRHLRRDRDADSGHGVQRAGDRRRRPPGRLRLGPAAGGPGRGELHPPAPGRPARRPGIGGQTVAGVRGRQADPLGPAEGRRGLRPSRRRRADRDRPAAVRGSHAGPVGPHAVHHRPGACGRPDWTGRTSIACCWWADRPACRWSATCSASFPARQPDDSVAADEAVAHGAALQASLILARQAGLPAAFKIKNVNSHSLGVVGIESLTKRRRNGILIPRNTPLPVTAKRTFKTTKAGQRSIRVEIVEGESPSAEDCTPVGHCSVRHLPPDLPAQYPVEVLFHYRAERAAEGPRHLAGHRSPGGHRDRPREQSQQGAHGRLAAVHLRQAADGLSVAVG